MGNRVHSLSEMKSLARKMGGVCLSEKYTSQTSKLLWKCGTCGHQWFARPAHVMNGSWCPICGRRKSDISRRRHTIKELDGIARLRGGSCLSTKYEGYKKHLLWKCSEGHEWKAQPGSIIAGTWCPICHGQPRYTIEDMKGLAVTRGGKCLSKKYVSSQVKLTWMCSVGHKWDAVPSSIIAGRWCPECGRGFGERVCRAFFEQKFRHPFPNVRPKWLLDKKGRPMELDGYCEELQLAFEHQGMQHYRIVKWGLSTKTQQLTETQKRDQLRQALCKKAGVSLVVIPSIGSLTALEDLEGLITSELHRQRVHLPEGYSSIRVDYTEAYRKARISTRLALCRKFATSKGGECLAVEYITARQKLRWRCAQGHEWYATPDNILRRGTWCPDCKPEALRKAFAHSIETMREIASDRGGVCLSNEYKNSKSILRWRCAMGHEWDSAASNVVSGTWCPRCAIATRRVTS